MGRHLWKMFLAKTGEEDTQLSGVHPSVHQTRLPGSELPAQGSHLSFFCTSFNIPLSCLLLLLGSVQCRGFNPYFFLFSLYVFAFVFLIAQLSRGMLFVRSDICVFQPVDGKHSPISSAQPRDVP